MSEPETVDALVLDLLEWIGSAPRPYDEVLDAWRTSCPRLPVWEEANERGFVTRHSHPGEGVVISVSAAGEAHLRAARAVQLV
jgi:D-3-phosphoglycerate dehydrogenase